MIDIGVNLTNSRFDKDRAEVISRAKSKGVNKLVVTGTNITESKEALKLCLDYPDTLYCTSGVHPHDADNVEKNYLSEIKKLAQNDCVKAIGECGLDFNRNFSAPAQQQKIFSEQIALAIDLQMPLFLHQRDAFEPWLALLKPALGNIPLIAHCFTGNVAEVRQCVRHDMYFGITGWLCDERRGADLIEAVKHIPVNRLLIETDAPYLTPRTIKPKPKSSRNEPSYLPYVLSKLAQTLAIPEKDLNSQIKLNTEQVFNL